MYTLAGIRNLLAEIVQNEEVMDVYLGQSKNFLE